MTGRTKSPRKPTAAELDLWRQTMRDAAPLRRRRRSEPGPAANPAEPPTAPPAAAPMTATTGPQPAPTPAPSPPPPPQQVLRLPGQPRPGVHIHLAPSLLGPKAGLDKRTDEKLRRGQLPIDGRIDLHGLTQDEAYFSLTAFVRSGHAAGRRLLLVITGKGGLRGADGQKSGGVLRGAVPRWLNEAALRPLVLAVHPAQPRHGGAGALYVFLRRQRP